MFQQILRCVELQIDMNKTSRDTGTDQKHKAQITFTQYFFVFWWGKYVNICKFCVVYTNLCCQEGLIDQGSHLLSHLYKSIFNLKHSQSNLFFISCKENTRDGDKLQEKIVLIYLECCRNLCSMRNVIWDVCFL